MIQQRPNSENSFVVIGLISVVGMVFTALQVQQSLFQGQLSLPITYDDISYFVGSMRRLHRFYDQGLGQLILDVFQVPPHSPTSTLTTLLGFSVFGSKDWAPAATNGIYVIAFLFFIAHITSHLSWFYRIAIAIIMLTCPLLGHLVVESRPDILCGLATACASFLILQSPGFKKQQSHQILAGVISGLALLAKPSISPITVVILLSALLFTTTQEWLYARHNSDYIKGEQQGLRKILGIFSQYITFLATTLLISVPYYSITFRRIAAYIYLNIFGADKEIWQNQDSFTGQALYYITGTGGSMMFGSWGAIVPLVALLALIAITLTKDWSFLRGSALYFLLVIVTYLLVTIPKTKSSFLGMAFGGMVLLFSLYLLIYLAQFLDRKSSSRSYKIIGIAACVAIPIISISLFQWPWFNKTGLPNAAPATQALYERSLIDSISHRTQEKLVNSNPQCAPQITFTGAAPYLNLDILEYYLLKQGFTNFAMSGNFRLSEFSEHWGDIKRSSYVVAFSLDNPTRIAWLPDNELQPRLLRRLRSDENFKLIDTFDRPASLGGGKVFLFAADQPCFPLLPSTDLRS
jgi:hypothetical protein